MRFTVWEQGSVIMYFVVSYYEFTWVLIAKVCKGNKWVLK